VELNLTGNGWRDLAGRRLEFTNPGPRPGDLARFALVQKGTAGDITASRKVKVPDIPIVGERRGSGVKRTGLCNMLGYIHRYSVPSFSVRRYSV